MVEEDNEIVSAGIDVLCSAIRKQDDQIGELQLENDVLKRNLSDNFDKLNNALTAVAHMQRLLVHHNMLPENRLINIVELNSLAPSSHLRDQIFDVPPHPNNFN